METKKRNMGLYKALLILGIIIFVLFVILYGLSKLASKITAEPAPPPDQKPIEEVSPTPPPNINIKVTSIIVKRVGSRDYRYYFHIRNDGPDVFNGNVQIKLITPYNLSCGEDSFRTTKPLKPNTGTAVYVDVHREPYILNPDTGCKTFDYAVTVNGQELNPVQGNPVTSKYEDLFGY